MAEIKKEMLNMNSNQSFYPNVVYCVIEIKASFYLFLSFFSIFFYLSSSKRRDTSFRARQAEVIDTSTKQPTVDSLLTPSE